MPINRRIQKDPFKTIASTYIPQDIKKAFRTAEDIYKSNIIIMRAIYKLAEYPITKLKYTAEVDKNDLSDSDLSLSVSEIEGRYREIFEEHLDINRQLIEINLNYYLYGNDFPILHMPFDRILMCKKCFEDAKGKIPKKTKDRDSRIRGIKSTLEIPIESLEEIKWDKDKFKAKCPACNSEQEFSSRDEPNRSNYSGISLGRLNPYRVSIQHVELSGSKRYIYTTSDRTKTEIGKIDPFVLKHLPLMALKAQGEGKDIEYLPRSVFHFKMPSPVFMKDSPWSWPLLISAYQTIFFIQMLRRGAEAIAQDHITPESYIAPAQNLDSLLAKFDMASVRDMLETAYQEGQEDDNRVAVLPMPIVNGTLNQHGRAFLPKAEIDQATQELLTGIGLPQGLLSGTGPYASNSIAIRILENGFLSQRDLISQFLDYASKKISMYFNLPSCKVELTEFKKLDDALHKNMISSAVSQKFISKKTFIKELGYDPEREVKLVEEEVERETKIQARNTGIMEREHRQIMMEGSAAEAAKFAENELDKMEKYTKQVISQIDVLVSKGYSKEWAMNYVAQFMAQQTAMMEQQNAQQRAMEAQQAFVRDRMANATTGLNRAENKLQMHQAMDAAMQDPAMQMLQQEDGQIGQIVEQAMQMGDHDRKRFLDEMQARQPTLWQQVLQRLGQ